MNKFFHKAILVSLLLLSSYANCAVIPNYNLHSYDKVIQKIYRALPGSHSTNVATRVAVDSRYFLNKPYLLEPLGEGVKSNYDQGPLYRADVFDCVTFVDTVLALAESKNLQEFKGNIINIRYYNSDISYINRTHWFIQVDWNPVNQSNGYLQDITNKVVNRAGKPVAKIATAIIDKPNWYKFRKRSDIKLLKAFDENREINLLKKLQAKSKLVQKENSTILYVPLNTLFDKNGKANNYIFNQIPSGAVIEIVRPNWPIGKSYGTNLNVSHLGLAIRGKNGLVFRNASSLTNSVMDIPLATYLHRYLKSPTIRGINIERIICTQQR